VPVGGLTSQSIEHTKALVQPPHVPVPETAAYGSSHRVHRSWNGEGPEERRALPLPPLPFADPQQLPPRGRAAERSHANSACASAQHPDLIQLLLIGLSRRELSTLPWEEAAQPRTCCWAGQKPPRRGSFFSLLSVSVLLLTYGWILTMRCSPEEPESTLRTRGSFTDGYCG